MILVFSALLFLAQSGSTLPDYHDPNEARFTFSEVCGDGSITNHFIQNSSNNYYLAHETNSASPIVLIRIVKVIDKNKIDSINYFIKSADGSLEKVEEKKWFMVLKDGAPEYVLFMQGVDEKCKIIYPSHPSKK